MTGINEAYDHLTIEGWRIIEVTDPSREFVDWMVDFGPDLWAMELDGFDIPIEHFILIKDVSRYIHFKLTWYDPSDYHMVEGSPKPFLYYVAPIDTEDCSRQVKPHWPIT